jgi:iron(III) transport system permease protein
MHGRLAWWRVTWPVARPAVAAGCALVLMETLADFGTVTYFGVDTLTAAIYRSWQGLGDRVAAARLAFVLLAMVGFLVLLERRQRQRMRFYARGAKPAPRTRLEGAAGWRAFALCSLPVLLGSCCRRCCCCVPGSRPARRPIRGCSSGC